MLIKSAYFSKYDQSHQLLKHTKKSELRSWPGSVMTHWLYVVNRYYVQD